MKHLKSTLLTLAALLCSTVASAYSFQADGIFYSITNSSALTVEVTYENSLYNSYSGDVVILSTVTYNDKVYTVTSIGSSAFRDCSSLTSIILPEGVTSIGNQAFYKCSRLTSIILPEGVTSIGSSAFTDCSRLTSIILPESVTSIGNSAFYGCSSLTSITIPEGVTSIGQSAFYGCSSLTSITIPEGVTSIGQNAFYNCSSLASITIPEGVTSIGYEAFSGCSSLSAVYISNLEAWCKISFGSFGANPLYFGKNLYLNGELVTELTIPGTLTAINGYTFCNCSNLTSIIIPESVTSIGYEAFSGCSSLTEIHIASIESWLNINYANYSSHPNCTASNVKLFVNGEELTEVEFPSSVTSVPSDAFRNCSSITSITIPESVTSIGTGAFYGCYGLKELIIEDGDKDLDLGCISFTSTVAGYSYGAFCNLPLESVYLGRNLKNTGALSHFGDCQKLESVEIGNSVTNIPDYTFYDCRKLTSIILPESVTSIGKDAFTSCYSLTEIHIASIESWLNINYANYSSHPNCTASNVKLFVNGEELTEVEVPSSVTSIPSDAFRNCGSITSITIPEGVTSIGTRAFSGCSSLTSIVLPESLTSIGNQAFSGCGNLISITIPESVTSIGDRVFYNGGIKELILKPTTPPALTTSSSFIYDYTVIVVPREAYGDYTTAPYWSDFLTKITIDDARVKSLTLKASDDKSSLLVALGEENLKFVTDLTISGSINSYDFMLMRNQMPLLRHLNLKDASIVYNEFQHYTGYHTEDNQFPDYGLYNCKLFSLTFPENITKVGNYGVYSNKYLSEMTLSKGVASIGNHAFYDCDALTAIILPDGLTSIGNSTFSMCDKLFSVTFPESIKTIGEYAFTYCEKLASITLFEGLTSIGKYAFRGCSSLEKVILPPTLKTINGYAFNSCSNLKEIRIPSSVRTVGDYAFHGCTSLNDVYVYTVEPFNIGQNTFAKDGNQFIGTLHAPKVSYWIYYYNTQWNQFANRAEFDEPYENFYLVGDKVLDNNTGAIEGEGDDAPDAEMGSNSGIIVEDNVTQDLGDVDIEHNGSDGGSIIVGGEGCVNADELHFHINVTGGRWYFFCFPFDVRREDIVLENGAEWVFRYYDGEERANNGKGGWKNVTSDGNGNHLKAATGYIFQCSKDDVLILTAKNQKIKQEKKYNELVEHVTDNMHDASWNFVGNPYLSYYEVTSDDYSAPITVWDGSKYIAIRPGDDDYQLAPFEAFFVQKPNGTDNIEYNPGQQMTYHQAQEAALWARARRRAMPVNPDRLLVNITLGNGTDSDQTRVVFNNEAAMGYETTCDAAKFETAGTTQLYTVDSRAVKYAINERPVAEGIVTMGYTAPAAGNYTLAAPRMDTPICIKDNLTGTIHDFSEGSYTFMTEAGTFEDRFTIMMKAGETGIENSEFRIQNSEIYDAAGRRVEKMEQGVYIKDNRKVVIK